jgi:3-deoxy-D-manno-octulosonic-acid transferase
MGWMETGMDSLFYRRLLWWCYNLLLLLAWPLVVCVEALQCVAGRRTRQAVCHRLGWCLPELRPGPPRIWFHALSVGEVHSVAPLVQALKAALPQVSIVFSTATETGREAARRVLASWVSDFFFLPHDFAWSMEALIRRIRPQLLVLVETDVWPNLLWTCRRHAVPCVLVNARLSPRSFARLRRLRALLRPVWGSFDTIFVQSAADLDRFQALDVCAERLAEVGNLKFDHPVANLSQVDRTGLRQEIGIFSERPVWIAGSTHEGEEVLLLRAHRQLLRDLPEALLIVAPRRIQRSPEVERLCRDLGLTVARRSEAATADGCQVFLLDTLGELARFYGLANLAFIGGSLVPFGGHNPLEALWLGVPMIWGPHLFNFRQIEEHLLAAGCAVRVEDEARLFQVVRQWLPDSALQKQVAESAKVLFNRHGGSSQRILVRLRQILRQKMDGI